MVSAIKKWDLNIKKVDLTIKVLVINAYGSGRWG
jgi:hypothetical protein